MKVKLASNVVYDPDTKGYIMLGVPDLHPQPLEFEGEVLQPKREYHCSLVAARKLANGDEALEQRIVSAVKKQLQVQPVEYVGLTGEIYVCHKTNENGAQQTTIIARSKIAGYQELRDVLHRDLRIEISLPHVTLLKSSNSPYGIGINSKADFDEYCERHDELRSQIFASR